MEEVGWDGEVCRERSQKRRLWIAEGATLFREQRDRVLETRFFALLPHHSIKQTSTSQLLLGPSAPPCQARIPSVDESQADFGPRLLTPSGTQHRRNRQRNQGSDLVTFSERNVWILPNCPIKHNS